MNEQPGKHSWVYRAVDTILGKFHPAIAYSMVLVGFVIGVNIGYSMNAGQSNDLADFLRVTPITLVSPSATVTPAQIIKTPAPTNSIMPGDR